MDDFTFASAVRLVYMQEKIYLINWRGARPSKPKAGQGYKSFITKYNSTEIAENVIDFISQLNKENHICVCAVL